MINEELSREDKVIKTFYDNKDLMNSREVKKELNLKLGQVRSTLENLQRRRMVERFVLDKKHKYRPCLYQLSDRGLDYANRKF